MKQQLQALTNILNHGSVSYSGRNGGTISLSGTTERYHPEDGVPLPTTKKVNDKHVALELEWFVKGLTTNRWLNERGVKIWDDWDVALMNFTQLMDHIENTSKIAYNKLTNLTVYRNAKTDNERLDIARPFALEAEIKITTGELGPVYGRMFRAWPAKDGATIDQITELDKNLANIPMSRRHVVSLWNPAFLPDETKTHAENLADDKQVLPPCHMSQQVIVSELSIDDICKHNALSLVGLTKMVGGCLFDISTEKLIDSFIDADVFTKARVLQILDGSKVDFLTYCQKANNGSYDIMGITRDLMSVSIYDMLKLRMELDIKLRKSVLEVLKSEGVRIYSADLQFYMRSNDAPLGRPFNVFSYYLLKEIICNVHNFVPGDLIHNTGNAHIYANQLEAVLTQLNRKPLVAPTMRWKRKLKSIADFCHDDYELIDYKHHGFISTPVSA